MTHRRQTTSGLEKDKTETRILPDFLYDFSQAVMGNHCRTLPAIILDGHNEGTISWLEAFQMRNGEWQLYMRSKDFSQEITADEGVDLSVGHHFEQIEIHPKFEGSFTLMDVLFKMSQFENEHKSAPHTADQNVLITDFEGHTLQDLGQKHYVAFGIAEAIAFDEKTGLPAPTFEGSILAEGWFSDEMEQSVKRAWDAKTAKHAQEGSYLDALMLNAKPTEMYQNLFDSLGRQKAFSEILSYFEDNIFYAFSQCQEKGFDFIITIQRDGSDTPIDISAGDALEDIIAETLGREGFRNTYKDLLTPEDTENIKRALITLDIFRCILHARWAIDTAIENPEYAQDSKNFVEHQISVIQSKYKQHGFSEADPDVIMQSIMDRESQKSVDIQKSIEKIRNDLNACYDQASAQASQWHNARSRDAIESDQNATKTPVPSSVFTPSRSRRP